MSDPKDRVRATAQALHDRWTATLAKVPQAASSPLHDVITKHLEAVEEMLKGETKEKKRAPFVLFARRS